jgi:molecular chaperone GrpE
MGAEIPVLLTELGGRLGKVEGQLAGFNQRAAHREAVIDRLHEENQLLRDGIGRIVLDPVVADLIRLYDQLEREVRRLGPDEPDGRLLQSFAGDVLEILERCGIEVFSAAPGDLFMRGQHRAVAVAPCDDGARHNTVAEVSAAGFQERDTGRVRRPVHVHVYQYSSGTASST